MNPSSFSHILHPTDFSRGDFGAYAHALRLGLAARSRLTLLHVSGKEEPAGWADFPHIRQTLSRWGFLPEGASREAVEATGLRLRKAMMEAQDPVAGITRYIEGHDPGLVVLATHQRGGWLFRSKSGAIARHTRALTLFVPRQVHGFVSGETGRVRLDHILAPVARRPSPAKSIRAIEALGELLALERTRIECLHVGDAADAPAIASGKRRGRELRHTCCRGQVVDTILEHSEARDTGLIVMATEGHHGFMDALRGSTTEQIVRGAKCPVLAIPA